MRRTKKNAQIASVVVLLVSIVIIVVTILFSKYIFTKMDTQISNMSTFSANTKAQVTALGENFDILDYAIIFIIISFTITLLITSYYIPTSPTFFVFNVIGVLFLALAAAILSNMYFAMSDNADIAATSATMPTMNYVMQYLPWLCTIIVFLSTIVMYSKGSTGGADPGNPYG